MAHEQNLLKASAQRISSIEVTSLSGLGVESHLITLTVDATTFNAAVEGSYSGTVTFEYKTT